MQKKNFLKEWNLVVLPYKSSHRDLIVIASSIISLSLFSLDVIMPYHLIVALCITYLCYFDKVDALMLSSIPESSEDHLFLVDSFSASDSSVLSFSTLACLFESTCL